MTRASILLILLPATAAAQAPAAAFVPGARTVAAFEFSTPGSLPAGVSVTQGAAAWGQRDGLPMLKASGPTVFRLSFPEVLPDHFTIEADFVSSSGSAQQQFAVGAAPTLVGTTRSALVIWHHHYTLVDRGGAAAGDKYFYPSPALLPELSNQLVHIQIVMDGAHFSIFTNDEQIGDYPNLVFKRDKFLMVYLGGEARPNGEVYLSKLRIGSNTGAAGAVAMTRPGSPGALATEPALSTPAAPGLALTGLVVTVSPQGAASATWTALPGATYLAMRWKVGDAACCNNVSPPGTPLSGSAWQDGPLPGAGTYGYRVIAMTAGGAVTAETQTTWTGPGLATSTPASRTTVGGTPAGRSAPPIASTTGPNPAPITPVLAAPASGTITPAAPPAGVPTPGTTMAGKPAPRAELGFQPVAPASVKVVRTSPTTARVSWARVLELGLNKGLRPPEFFLFYVVDRWTEGNEGRCEPEFHVEGKDPACIRDIQFWENPKYDDPSPEPATKYYYRVTALYEDPGKCLWGSSSCSFVGSSAAPVAFTMPPNLNPIGIRNTPVVAQPRMDLVASVGKSSYTGGFGGYAGWYEATVTWTWKLTPNVIGWVIRVDEGMTSYYDNNIKYGALYQEILSLNTSPSYAKSLRADTSYRTCIAAILDPNIIPDPLRGECLVTTVGK